MKPFPADPSPLQSSDAQLQGLVVLLLLFLFENRGFSGFCFLLGGWIFQGVAIFTNEEAVFSAVVVFLRLSMACGFSMGFDS